MISEDVYMEDLVRDHPEAVAVLVRHGVVCIQCGEAERLPPGPVWGTLGEALDRAGIGDRVALMAEINVRRNVQESNLQ